MKETKILIISPLQDPATVTSNLAVHEIMRYAATKWDLDIDYLPFLLANRWVLTSYLKKKKYDLIIYYGHGYPNNIKGNHHWNSLLNSKNIKLVGDTPMDVMACYTARDFGKQAINSGVKTYIGTTTAYWAAFNEKERCYLDDWINYTTIRAKMLMDGATFGEAFQAFQDRGRKYLNIYEANRGYRNYDWYADTLSSNLLNTVLLGDPTTKIK